MALSGSPMRPSIWMTSPKRDSQPASRASAVDCHLEKEEMTPDASTSQIPKVPLRLPSLGEVPARRTWKPEEVLMALMASHLLELLSENVRPERLIRSTELPPLTSW